MERDEATTSATPPSADGEETFALTFRDGPVPMSISELETGRFLDVNRAWEEFSGYSREELIGRTTTELGFLSPAARDGLLATMAKHGRIRNHTLEVRTRSGRTLTTLLSVAEVTLQGRRLLLSTCQDISQVTGELVQSQANLTALIESTGDLVWSVDRDYGLMAFNSAFAEHFRTIYGTRAYLGATAEVLLPPDRAATWPSLYERTFTQGPFHMEATLPDDRVLELAFQPIRTGDELLGASVFAKDITARQRALERARVLETSIDCASDAAYWMDAAGRFRYVNASACRMLGYTRDELLGLGLRDLNPAVTPAVWAETLRTLRRTKVRLTETRHRRKDGTWLPVEVSSTLINLDGVEFINGFARDLTERIQVDREKALLLSQLQQSQKMESLGVLAGGVAHDMNNVLGAILALASVNLLTQARESTAYAAFETISEAATRGGKMVKGLLAFARQNPVEVRELDLNKIFQDEVQLLEHTTLAKVTLALDLDPELRHIQGDEHALIHAFMNLCVNAVDAMPGQGTLTLRTRNLDPGWVEAVVEDDGTGMPREVLERALDPFFTTKEVGKGTGLGLSLVYATMKAHKGTLELESVPGQGTRVRLRFPSVAPGAPAPALTQEVQAWSNVGPLELLLVDDDDLVLRSTLQMVQALGLSARTASSGEDALAAIRDGYLPDLIILDMNMPGLGGAATVPLLREICPEVPILLATGRADESAMAVVSANEGVTLLCKPYDFADLQRHLEAAGKG